MIEQLYGLQGTTGAKYKVQKGGSAMLLSFTDKLFVSDCLQLPVELQS